MSYFNSEEIQNFAILANIATIIGLVATTVSILLVWYQLKQTKKIEEAKLWLELRNIFFDRHEDIHVILRNGEEIPDDKWHLVDAYMGQFELCQRLIENGFLSKDLFIMQYEYRIQNIINNEEVVETKLKDEVLSWQKFIKLCKDLNLIETIYKDNILLIKSINQ